MTGPGGHEDSLQANRAGRLSEPQLRRLQARVNSRSGGGVEQAIVHALSPVDKALAKDLRAGRVESVEGEIRKKAGADWTFLLGFSQNPGTPDYWISVTSREGGKQEFRVSTALYESAPGAGRARLYYLPHSRQVVNLEIFPDPRDPAPWLAASAPGGERLEPAAVAEAIIGTWSNPFVTLTVRGDRTLTTRLAGRPDEHSRWSVDADGRLYAEFMGAPQVADVSVAGDTLTLTIGGQPVKLLRSDTC